MRGTAPRGRGPAQRGSFHPPCRDHRTGAAHSIGWIPRAAAIILAGGRSSRMGSPKAGLDWHGSTLVRRVSGIAARSVDGPVVVVRAPGQQLPDLGPGVEVATDAREGRGPMQGIAAGLAVIADRAPVAYISST